MTQFVGGDILQGATKQPPVTAGRTKHRLLFIGLPVAVLAVAGAAWLGFRREPWRLQAASYRTVIASRGPIVAEVRATGQIAPRISAPVPARLSGQVVAVLADVNAQVKNGEVLARLDDKQALQHRQMAKAELAQAEAVRAVRAAAVAELGSAGDESAALMTAKAQLDLADAEVGLKKAQLGQSELELAQAAITSPIDGIVLQRSIDLGSVVNAERPDVSLFKIGADLHIVIVRTEVEESEIGGVQIGQEARVSVAALPGRSLPGRVKAIELDPQSSPRGAIYIVQIEIDNQRQELLPGMNAQIDILGERRNDVLRIPNEALRWRPSAVLVDSRDNPIQPWQDDGTVAETDPAGPFGSRGQGGYGPGRVMLDRLRNDLQLNEEQTQQLEKIAMELRSTLGDPRAMEPDERRQKLREFRAKFVERLNVVLLPEQKTKFAQFRQTFIDTGRDRPGGVPGRIFILERGVPKRIDLRLGISDGRQTELLAGGLPPDALLIVGGGPPPFPPAIRPARSQP